MNNNNTQTMQEDEIDLRELFKTIVRKKVLIASITIIATLIGVINAYSKTPIYEVKSNIQVGFIGKNLIVEPDTLIKILNIVFNVEDKKSTNGGFVSDVTSISTNINLKNFIEVKTEAISNDEAIKKNEEVLTYINELHKPKIEQYIVEIKNSIEDKKRAILNIDNFDIKNVEEQIRLLKQQTIAQIDEKIKRLQEQDIKKLEQKIKLLKSQKLVEIDEEIKFLKDFNIKAIESKIDFHSKKLNEYSDAINKLYKNSQNNLDTATMAISSMQMVNYQNLILSSQNEIEDLKINKEILLTKTVPNLQNEKRNIIDIVIKDLELEIENIKNVTIVDLKREKNNISNDQIRKLQHMIDVEFVEQKIKLGEEIERLNYSITQHNIKKSELIGDYIVHNYPIKPKKRLIIVVAFITGLILSIFFVFFLEFIRNEKEQSAQ